MRTDRRGHIVPATLLVAALTASSALAGGRQDQQTVGPEPVVFLSSNLVQGELLRVDIDAERFVVREPNGSEMELALSERTRLLGVDDIRDLALHAGSRVSVKFARDDGDKVATSVRVHPKIETLQRR